MTTTLGTFAEEVSTVARRSGIEGKLGVQSKGPGAMGTWRQLTDKSTSSPGNFTPQKSSPSLRHCHRGRTQRESDSLHRRLSDVGRFPPYPSKTKINHIYAFTARDDAEEP